MSKHKRGGIAGRKKRTQIGGQWVPYRVEMIQSPAFRVLSLQARKILHRLEIEHCAHGGAENGRLPCRYYDFETYGSRRKAISLAIREAEALGFIQTMTLGSRAYGDIPGKASTYRLTYLHTEEGFSDEWKKINTIEEARALVAAAAIEHEAWLDATQGSPRQRQRKKTGIKTKRQGAKCPRSGGEVPPNKGGSQGAKCHLQAQGGEVPPPFYILGRDTVLWVQHSHQPVTDHHLSSHRTPVV